MEKRRYPRTRCGVPVTFVLTLNGETQGDGTSIDISLGGVFIQTSYQAPFGTPIVLQVALEGSSSPLLLFGTVRWSGPSGFGVQFGSLGVRETRAIMELGASSP